MNRSILKSLDGMMSREYSEIGNIPELGTQNANWVNDKILYQGGKMMDEWLKTECGEFKKPAVQGARLDLLVLPKPRIAGFFMMFDYNKFWRVEVLVDGVWTGATNYVEDESEARERLNNIMQEIKKEA